MPSNTARREAWIPLPQAARFLGVNWRQAYMLLPKLRTRWTGTRWHVERGSVLALRKVLQRAQLKHALDDTSAQPVRVGRSQTSDSDAQGRRRVGT